MKYKIFITFFNNGIMEALDYDVFERVKVYLKWNIYEVLI